MNMISTGSFLTEMDASNKQNTLAQKFAAVWEKKNAKVARAGGASLMALSLAACGGSDDVVADGGSTTPVASQALTTTDGDVVTGTAGNDVIAGVVSSTSTANTYDSDDSIIDASSTDADVLNISANQDITTTATVTGIETVNITLDALSSGGGAAGTVVTDFDVKLDNISKGTAINFDSVNANSIVSGLVVTGDKGGVRNTSDDFTSVTTTLTADSTATYNVSAAGSAASAVSFSASGAADNLTIDAAGYIDVTAAAVTDLVNISAAADVTVTSATASAAVLVNSGGDVTITDADSATVVKVTAAGDITAAADALEAALAPTLIAGKTVTADLNAATSATVEGAKTITLTDDAAGGAGVANTLATVSATVKTEATTIDLDGAAGVSTVVVNGDQDYTLVMSAAAIGNLTGDKITVTDNTTAGTSTLKLTTGAGDVDASANVFDNINLAIDNAGSTLTVASGQVVTQSVDNANGGTVTIAGKAATAATNTVTVNLDDGTDAVTTTASDILGTLAFSNIAEATINANLEQLVDGSKETHVIDAITGNGAAVTINMGANDLSVTGAVNLGANDTLTITGSGKVTGDGNEAITAKAIDASNVSGVVTLLEIQSDQVSSVTTGSGNDVLETTDHAANGANADLTINTGAGDDKLTLHAEAADGESLTIDMGDGDDTLVFVASQTMTRTGTDLNTVVGVENLNYAGAFTVDSSVINNATWDIKDTGGNAVNLTVTVLASDTAIDLSGLTVSAANAAATAGDTFIVNASGAAVDGVTSITGALIAKNTITANDLDATTIVGGNKADALNGGAKADTITGGEGADTITGHEGNDTIILTETTSAADTVAFNTESENGVDTIIGFNSAKDLIQVLASDTAGGTAQGAATTVAASNVALTAGAAAYDISDDITAIVANVSEAEDVIVIGTALSSHGDLDVGTDGTELLKALSSTSTAATQITTDSASELFLVAYQDGNAYMFHAEAGAGDTAVVASEITLMGIFQDVAVGTISAADFAVLA